MVPPLQPLLLLLLIVISFSPLSHASSSSSSSSFHLFTTRAAAAKTKSTSSSPKTIGTDAAAKTKSTSSSTKTIGTDAAAKTQAHSTSSVAAKAADSTSLSTNSVNPFTAKAAAIRYWDRKITANHPHPDFLVSKLSPLSALDETTYSTLVASNPASITSRLAAFCSAARLLCSPALSPSLVSHDKDSNFAGYQNSNFTNYGRGFSGGLDSFKNYSDNLNVPVDTFRQYSRDSTGHDDKFSFYSPDGNVVTSNFTSYATSATGGMGKFTSYAHETNVPDLTFTNYEAEANGRVQGFTSYSDDTNAGSQSFAGYGKHGNGVPVSFASYANNSNVITSGFSGYGEDGNAANDTFANYGFNGNVPENGFRSYGENGNAGSDTFISYRDQSNVGDDTFQSYAKNENSGNVKFTNYGNSFNPGSDRFKGYGEGSATNNPNIVFKGYAGDNTSFAGYSKTGVTFKSYKNASVVPSSMAAEGQAITESKSNKRRANRWVEPGKFFRESELRESNVMPMPDIRDKMPVRAFLPRSISGKLPFSAAELTKIFATLPDTALGKAMANTVAECERAPSRGETKKCATSMEDMVDFAVSVLGSDAVVRSTDSPAGSVGDIMIGKVKGINGGKVTKSVSCHQSLFPYLVYYCHSVPKVRVYEADILSVKSREKINHGVAICHLDTSDWSAGHGAFLALGSKPGQIEVCHWIFQGDMTWAVAD